MRRARFSSLFWLLSILTTLVAPVQAAPGDHAWSRGFDPEARADITADGSVYMSGMFYSTVDFGGGPLVPSGFNGDMFVAKFDAAGNHVFSFAIVSAQGQMVSLVRTDPSGGAYIVGRAFSGSVDFGGGPLSPSTSLWVVRYDAAGNHVFSGLYGDAEVADAVVDAQGIVLAGATRSTANFGGGALTTAGGTDALIARLSDTGAHVFSAIYGDAFDQYVRGVGIDGSGRPVMAVQIAGTVDFGGGPLVPAGYGLALVELDAAGAHARSTLYDGNFTSGITYNVHLDVADDGTIAVAGELHGSTDFGGGSIFTNGNTDVFVALFDTDGTHLFSQSYGSASYQVVNSVDIAPDGSVLVSGNFVNSVDFGGGSLTAGATQPELFFARLDATGAHLSSTQYASASGGAYALSSVDAGNGATLLVASGSPDLDLGGGPLGTYYNFVGVLEGTGTGTAVRLPSRAVLSEIASHPNPFNPRTVLTFRLEQDARVTLSILDARGRRVLERDLGALDAGRHEFAWDGRDARGASVASGVYTAHVRVGTVMATRSLVLVR